MAMFPIHESWIDEFPVPFMTSKRSFLAVRCSGPGVGFFPFAGWIWMLPIHPSSSTLVPFSILIQDLPSARPEDAQVLPLVGSMSSLPIQPSVAPASLPWRTPKRFFLSVRWAGAGLFAATPGPAPGMSLLPVPFCWGWAPCLPDPPSFGCSRSRVPHPCLSLIALPISWFPLSLPLPVRL